LIQAITREVEKQRHTPAVQAIHNENKISASQSLASSAEKAVINDSEISL
jgi:hypothetical protein